MHRAYEGVKVTTHRKKKKKKGNERNRFQQAQSVTPSFPWAYTVRIGSEGKQDK